ncbi:hypothetical protein MMC26_000910 [Xylographa opegraphella]|nr:hypothetical protein [Xylographa opegraphella]
MGPRKKTKPNPEAELAAKVPLPKAIPLPDDPEVSGVSNTPTGQPSVASETKEATSTIKKVQNGGPNTSTSKKGWYGGTWPRTPKAAPITQVAMESISSASASISRATGTVSIAASSIRGHEPQSTSPPSVPSLYLSRNLEGSSRSLPISATKSNTNRFPASDDGPHEAGFNAESEEKPNDHKPLVGSKLRAEEMATDQKDDNAPDGAKDQLEDVPIKGQEITAETQTPNQQRWLGWFSKTEAATNPPGGANIATVSPTNTPDLVKRRNSDPILSNIATNAEPPKSWLGIWGNTAGSVEKVPQAPIIKSDVAIAAKTKVEDVALKPEESTGNADHMGSSGWAFWSRGNISTADLENPSSSNVGELAVAGSKSQSEPESAVMSVNKKMPAGTGKSSKRERPQSLEVSEDVRPTSRSTTNSTGNHGTAIQTHDKSAAAKLPFDAQAISNNLILPSLKQTYRHEDTPGLLEQLRNYLYATKATIPRHVSLLKEPPRIKKALAIGVHGYFPAPLLRSVLGQPTGTSIRFADSAASAIRKWTEAHGYSCETEKIALEGEGKIEERVDLLWKLILNWIEDISKSDFILIACHSQGVPVAIMLVAKLIKFGCVNGARIGICAMAGVNLGPFADYKSRWISGSAGELFDFARPDSRVSKDYEAALEHALKFGVKIVYVGSIDDQLVSLESSTFGVIEHPYIFRAVFVDGRVHASDFITHLVAFALKLRNLGVPDHGLIRELSSPLAGSLYGGEGHSRIYEDPAVYSLAVEYALETTAIPQATFHANRSTPPISQNPYILPFAMRGVLEEEYVRAEMLDEMNELLKQFDAWKPASKVLKDVKFRLEGVRSKL